jgi:hypothetical protein
MSSFPKITTNKYTTSQENNSIDEIETISGSLNTESNKTNSSVLPPIRQINAFIENPNSKKGKANKLDAARNFALQTSDENITNFIKQQKQPKDYKYTNSEMNPIDAMVNRLPIEPNIYKSKKSGKSDTSELINRAPRRLTSLGGKRKTRKHKKKHTRKHNKRSTRRHKK